MEDRKISQIGSNVIIDEMGTFPQDERQLYERKKDEFTKTFNRGNVHTSKLIRNQDYLDDIEKLKKKDFKNLTEDEIKKYYQHFMCFTDEEIGNMKDNEKELFDYTIQKRNEVIIHGMPADPEQPAAPGIKVAAAPVTTRATEPVKEIVAPAVSPPAPLQAVPSESISATAQPASKKSKVSLARQQAANAPVDST